MFVLDPGTARLWIGKNGIWRDDPASGAATWTTAVSPAFYPQIHGRTPGDGGTLRVGMIDAASLYLLPRAMRAFREGLDVHRATAAEVFGVSVEQVSSEQRRYAKVINFGLIYGMSAFGLAKALGIDNSAAKNYITRYFERFAGVKRYMDDTREQAKAQGYVETVFGRRLYLPEINSPNGPRRAGAERAAINAPMQGTAADLIKMSMVAVQKAIDEQQRQTKVIMQVHDELVFEVPESEVEWVRTEVPRLMAEVAQLKVPLLAEVGVGLNWDEAH